MASTSNFEPKVLMSKGKRATAAYIHADCATDRNPEHLKEVLDNLLNPVKRIDEWETIDWCKWLMAGGRTPDEFAKTVRDYDYATTCGLVWTPNFIAYRCRTCGISPCMSLCTDCFKKGNHYDHDFNMFLSQAGGACDCGDTSVMKATGFCDSHGPGKIRIKGSAPSDLMCVAEAMMPRIILRLVQHLREFSGPDSLKIAVQDADAFLTMLLDFNNMGGLMRRVMATALTNPTKYKALNEIPENVDSEYAQYLIESKRVYEEAVRSLPNVDLDIYEDLKDYPALQKNLVHTTFLEELVFWTVKFEFPQKVVCLLLNMLPDTDFKEALTRAFVLHFSRISIILEKSPDPDTLSNRIVHVSVQLFSNEGLAMRMTEQLNLLHVMVVSLKNMMNKILIPDTSHNPTRNCHYVVDCTTSVMKDHCYWPLVSDLNNVLSHRPIALKFMSDDTLLEMWFSFLSMYQGMNLNQKLVGPHVEFEPNSYYAAFSAELEASAYPMWALVTHLTDHTTAHLTRRVLNACIREWYEWIKAMDFKGLIPEDSQQITFHLPLHRYLATFLCQGVARQGIRIEEILPANDFMLTLLIVHPLKLQVAFYEILNGVWVRNGLQIKGQAMTYIQCNFSNSMLDLDLYLLQICCTRVNTERFLSMIIEQFRIKRFLSLAPFREAQDNVDFPMVENCLLFLATLINLRTNLGLPDKVINRLEIVTILCGNDKTHSQLIDLIPERYGTQTRDFEEIVAECADYRNHALDPSGTMQQGMYTPKASVWEHHYDPIHLLLRAVHRKDFQNSMDRYTEHCRQTNKLKPGVTPWPPFKAPLNVGENYIDPRHILTWNVFQSMAFIILYKAVNSQVPEQVIAFTLFLLEQSVYVTNIFKDTYSKLCLPQPNKSRHVVDGDLGNWFKTGHVFDNFRTVIPKVVLPGAIPDIVPSPILYSSPESDVGEDEVTSSGSDDIVMSAPDGNQQEHLMLEQEYDIDYSVADEEDMQLMLYTNSSNSIDEARSVPESPVEIISPSMALLPASAESAVVPMDVDDRTVAIPGDKTLARQSEDGTEHSAPAKICNYPALMAGTEVIKSNSPDSSRLVPHLRQSRPSTGEGFAFPSTSQGFSRRRHPYRPKKSPTELPEDPTLEIQESIISLLLKLHSKLSGILDSFDPDDEEIDYLVPDDKVPCGDGPFYVGKLLKRIAVSDKSCYDYIQRTRKEIWPSNVEKEKAKQMRQNKEREDRRRRAKERQEKLMAEFAAKQREFLKREQERMETDENGETLDQSNISISKQEYDCAICNITSPSTEEMPMGLVASVHSTAVIGHRRKYGQPEVYMLPTSDDDKERIRNDNTLSAEFDRKVEEFNSHFDPESWFMAVNTGWNGGVHMQTCGHHLHLQCLNSYISTLQRTQSRPQAALSHEKGEFSCPVCRQLGNTVLPVSSQYGDKSQIVRTRTNKGMMQILDEIGDFLKDNEQKPSSSPMAEAKGKVMEVMSNCTQIKPLFKSKNDTPVPQSLFLFFTSIARTNLEVELVQRYGSLVKLPNDPPNMLLPKRDCVAQLMDVLGTHSRVSTSVTRWPACTIFRRLCGLPPLEPATSLAPIEREVPFLLKDPTALLLQFVLLLPSHIDQIYFTATVQMMYNLLYYQVVAQISCGLTSCERASAAKEASREEFRNFVDALGLVTECLGHTELYMDDDDLSERGPITDDNDRKINSVALEQQVQRLCLPFLRIASLLKYHLYNHPLPDIPSPQSEFVRLVYYLELVTKSMDWKCFNASVALNWPRNSDLCRSTPRLWCNEFAAFVTKSQIAARSFLMDQTALWHSPRLLTLPAEYERIFTYYHERPCNQCHSVAQETSICLLCGTIVCMKQNCCKQQNVCEAVAHAQECGAGTAPFLVVTSTYVIVIRGPRACLWGTLYLDVFEEEDKDLKRGKPLFLCEDRFRLLEQQWLAHRFEHTKKAWILHRNAL
ncbi:E3 ubiquitin-protein ligase Ubr3 isoform X2 [Dendroctonus ponderosae]|uniref:E3 ubiquitin-protein ligase Ubr3 isoform X2 n=1 Tax=Dendroctonus ponderosae TaxID=77166 RepID=UPI002035C731|nr:E3 ubiquitin-protein ligase Ubr3 isoform X2 [Dendroctonus ponderosae]